MSELRDISIINALPFILKNGKFLMNYGEPSFKKHAVLTVGCGNCRLERILSTPGWKKRFSFKNIYFDQLQLNVLATDEKKQFEDEDDDHFEYRDMNILNPDLRRKYPVVICSEVLEHIEDYETAFRNLVKLATHRVIVTVPYELSFYDPTHINIWSDQDLGEREIQIGMRTVPTHVRDINEFKKFSKYSTSISKIRSKPEDIQMKQHSYLIVVDKLHEVV